MTAKDMKAALESHGGIKGCRASVVNMDTTKERNQDSKIPGISVQQLPIQEMWHPSIEGVHYWLDLAGARRYWA